MLSRFKSGAALTGGIKLFDNDAFVFGASVGNRMARYIDVISELGLNAKVNPARTGQEALPGILMGGLSEAFSSRW